MQMLLKVSFWTAVEADMEVEVRMVIALWIVGCSDGEIWGPIASRHLEQPLRSHEGGDGSQGSDRLW
jgi:hypothetical protein